MKKILNINRNGSVESRLAYNQDKNIDVRLKIIHKPKPKDSKLLDLRENMKNIYVITPKLGLDFYTVCFKLFVCVCVCIACIHI